MRDTHTCFRLLYFIVDLLTRKLTDPVVAKTRVTKRRPFCNCRLDDASTEVSAPTRGPQPQLSGGQTYSAPRQGGVGGGGGGGGLRKRSCAPRLRVSGATIPRAPRLPGHVHRTHAPAVRVRVKVRVRVRCKLRGVTEHGSGRVRVRVRVRVRNARRGTGGGGAGCAGHP